MAIRYVPYGSIARPTREETMEMLFETYLVLKKQMKKLENIVVREQGYVKRKNQKQ